MMEKKDLVIVSFLVVLFISWNSYLYPKIVKPLVNPTTPQDGLVTPEVNTNQPAPVANAANTNAAPLPAVISATPVPGVPVVPVVPGVPGVPGVSPAVAPAAAAVAVEAGDGTPGQIVGLKNKLVDLQLSSKGATLVRAEFEGFHVNGDNPHPVIFDFAATPSLELQQIPGLSAGFTYEVSGQSSNAVTFTRTNGQGVKLTRSFTLDPDNYVLRISDVYLNGTLAPLVLPEHKIAMGMVSQLEGVSSMYPTMGVDAYYQNKVTHYTKKLMKWLKKKEGPFETRAEMDVPVDWLCVKNKFFGHILKVEEGDMGLPAGYDIYGKRAPEDKWPMHVSGALSFSDTLFQPGQSFEREYTYYVGPKKLGKLKQIGGGFTEMMEYGLFAIFTPICNGLLRMLNMFYNVVGNYGVAIILLTLFVKILFWPLTHKGTESMKKMSDLAPEIQKLKDKHKDPQKQQQAMMALYKEHKINPVSGCMPMLIQIPVFIALFGVLRSAVELWNADFLWVLDLSEPERMIAHIFPFGGGLNVLPLAMAASMFFQQKLMPQAGDPTQQKVMQFMPLMLLVFCYQMAAGLLLYWTTSNLLAIAQQLHRNKKKDVEAVVEPVKKEPVVLPPKRKRKKKK
ncbi:MAG: YidC/Oxa1 family membrane protein insertase [Verrucomicrobiales bacterium]|jgi:YidC/Oxa1 family membrane protein insertase